MEAWGLSTSPTGSRVLFTPWGSHPQCISHCKKDREVAGDLAGLSWLCQGVLILKLWVMALVSLVQMDTMINKPPQAINECTGLRAQLKYSGQYHL